MLETWCKCAMLRADAEGPDGPAFAAEERAPEQARLVASGRHPAEGNSRRFAFQNIRFETANGKVGRPPAQAWRMEWGCGAANAPCGPRSVPLLHASTKLAAGSPHPPAGDAPQQFHRS